MVFTATKNVCIRTIDLMSKLVRSSLILDHLNFSIVSLLLCKNLGFEYV